MEILIFVFAILIMIALFVVFSAYLQRSAVISVIKLFRVTNALEEENAVTSEELGILPKSFIRSIMRRRDYKPQALDLLKNLQVVKVTEDNKLYFSEDDLLTIQERSSTVGKLFLPKV